uniref:Uncharacterized protein n=1 Tax=Anguilla anguilla TaxID=7936 RepID=A0A0E9TDB2_ANGAN
MRGSPKISLSCSRSSRCVEKAHLTWLNVHTQKTLHPSLSF